jgi:hypothetical protein
MNVVPNPRIGVLSVLLLWSVDIAKKAMDTIYIVIIDECRDNCPTLISSKSSANNGSLSRDSPVIASSGGLHGCALEYF